MELTITQTKFKDGDIKAVNSRDIYKELKIKQGYSDWIKYQISKLVLKEDVDFTKHIYVIGKNKITDYIVTTDVAKNIGLISFTEKGQEIRNYFIEAEKESQALIPNAMREVKLALQGLVEVDHRLDTHHDRIKELELTRRIENWQRKGLKDTHDRKVYQLAREYKQDQHDKKLVASLHRKIWSLHNKHFILSSYAELSAIKYEEAIEFISNLSLKDMV